MNANTLRHMVIILLSAAFFASSGFAGSAPRLNNGKKWRIGYYEGGPYSDYTETMRTLVDALIALGWIDEQNPPEYHEEMPKPYMDWLIHCRSPYLSFRAEDIYSAGWKDRKRTAIRKDLLKKLKSSSLDLVIAMGTWAGQDLANKEHSVPVMVLSTSNPIQAGIIQSGDNSGFDHVTARVDPERYLRQIRMFHRIAGFDTLGIAFEDTADGRIYSAMNEVRKIAEERNFKVITCNVIDSTPDTRESDASCLECFRRLSQISDAVYVTALTCIDRQPRLIADILRNARIPSFSMIGSRFVQAGMMLSISSDSGYEALGKYNAMKFGEILNGTKPVDLNQVFEDPLNIAVNMETVRRIGFHMPKSILKIASEIYEE